MPALPICCDLLAPVLAYVGPGAGIAVAGSLLLLVLSALLGLLAVLAAPVVWLWAGIRRLRRPKRGPWRRVVVLGFDGMDPRLCERWMADGTLTELSALCRRGSFQRLATTFPAISPAAWASFSTGVRPSKHGVFDFLTLDRATYRPELSSARVLPSMRRWPFPPRPRVVQLRRGVPVWTLLAKRGWPATVLRVPITFPPDAFPGRQLSGMCLPDLRGSQGSYTLFTTRADRCADAGDPGVRNVFGAAGTQALAGDVVQLGEPDARGVYCTAMPGPPDPVTGQTSMAPMTMRVDGERVHVAVHGGTRLWLTPGSFSDWVAVPFRTGGQAFRGVCRLRLLSIRPDIEVYASPLMIDPLRPVLPISQPAVFAPWLAATRGRFATLGLAEDTTAFDDGILDAPAFLEQCWQIHEQREAALDEALATQRDGVLIAVFDGTDRIQHMHWREDGPAGPADGDATDPATTATTHAATIRDAYSRFDALVGRVQKRLRDDDLLLVLSDHGFTGFQRQVCLNRWLLDTGYLALSEGIDPAAVNWLEGIDWSRTRAFAVGLTGITLNVAGRERNGIVPPDGAPTLRHEIAEALAGLCDPERDTAVVSRVLDVPTDAPGPFADRGPDLLVGWAHGYRVAWATVRGRIGEAVIADNLRRWSGDHGVDPALVPGVLFASEPVAMPPGVDRGPHLVDLAPTLASLFGVDPAPNTDGVTLQIGCRQGQ